MQFYDRHMKGIYHLFLKQAQQQIITKFWWGEHEVLKYYKAQIDRCKTQVNTNVYC